MNRPQLICIQPPHIKLSRHVLIVEPIELLIRAAKRQSQSDHARSSESKEGNDDRPGFGEVRSVLIQPEVVAVETREVGEAIGDSDGRGSFGWGLGDGRAESGVGCSVYPIRPAAEEPHGHVAGPIAVLRQRDSDDATDERYDTGHAGEG